MEERQMLEICRSIKIPNKWNISSAGITDEDELLYVLKYKNIPILYFLDSTKISNLKLYLLLDLQNEKIITEFICKLKKI